MISTPNELGTRDFIGLEYPLTWDRREEKCYYAGSRQAGATNYVPLPEDTVIEESYEDYIVQHNFDTSFKFSMFNLIQGQIPALHSEFQCRNTEHN